MSDPRPQSYRAALVELLGGECERCHTKEGLVVHHVNGNPRDGKPHNLQVLCGKCHPKNGPGLVEEDPQTKKATEWGIGDNPKVRSTVLLPHELWVSIRRLSQKSGYSLNDIMLAALRRCLPTWETPIKRGPSKK